MRKLVATGFLTPQPVRRGARGAREVPYLATGKSWTVDVGEQPPYRDGVATRAMVDAFLQDLAQVEDRRKIAMHRLGLRLTEAEYEELRGRIMNLLDEIAARPRDPYASPYSMFVVLHPDPTRRQAPPI